MLKREIRVPPEHLFPPDPWRLIEERFTEEYFARAETAFALANGYIGMRGTFDEATPAAAPGVLVSGLHETWPIIHAEDAFGLARTGQTLVQVPDATVIQLYVDDEPLFLPTAQLRRYRRVLDMRAGTLARALVWATPAGKHVDVRSCRLVSLEHRHLAAVAYEVVVHDAPAPIVVCSRVVNRQEAQHAEADAGVEAVPDPRLTRRLPGHVLDCEVFRQADGRALLGYRTARSRMTLGVGVDHVIETDLPYTIGETRDGDRGEVVLTAEAQPGVPLRIVKYVAYHTVQSIVASEIGDEERALAYFRFALLMDLADASGNASDGVHIACAAGVWQALVFGFGGVRDRGGELDISPRLPAGWDSLGFSLRVHDRQLRIALSHEEERIVLESGDPLEIWVRGRRHSVLAGQPLCLPAPAGRRSPAEAPA